MKKLTALSLAIFAGSFLAASAPAGEADPANALLVVPSDTAFDRKFQDFLDKNGAKLLQSHPPSVFIGYIPQSLDSRLKDDYGAEVYREQVKDWTSFARYGENAIYAVNAWNKRFLENPPEAPLVVSGKVQKAGRRSGGINLVWNEVMKAVSYRLQISRDEDFSDVQIETLVSSNKYPVYPGFLPEGVYYWRVAGILRLNTGESRESGYSEAYSFAISNHKNAGKPPRPPSIAGKVGSSREKLTWPSVPGGKFYRLQLSASSDFGSPVLDVFTSSCDFPLSGLALERGSRYYVRVMASNGGGSAGWSEKADFKLASSRRKSRKKR